MATRKFEIKQEVLEPKTADNNKMAASLQATSTLIEQFEPDDQRNLGSRWEKWINRLNKYFIANDMKVDDEAAQMEATLFLLAGSRVEEIFETLTADAPDGTADNIYDQACAKLKVHFNPIKNRMMEEFNFRSTKQDSNEGIEQYVTRLRVLAKHCEFNNVDREIMTQVVLSCYSTKLRRELLKAKELTIVRLLELGRIHDTLKIQVESIEGRKIEDHYEDVNQFNSRDKRSFKSVSNRRNYGNDKSKTVSNVLKCFKCGGQYPHEKVCPAAGKECRRCKKLHHFEKCCRQKSNNSTVNELTVDKGESQYDSVFTI